MHGCLLRHLLLLVVLCLLTSPARAQQELLFVIRVDDVQSRSSIAPRSLDAFESAVASRGGRITWAVIPHRLIEPQNEDGVLAAELRASAARGHEIAVHGYTHICARCGQSSHEMYCTRDGVAFTLEQQRELVATGTDLLRDLLDVSPRTFVPPGHVMDATTLEALAAEGLDVISTTAEHGVDLADGVYNVAPTAEYTWALGANDYRGAMDAALDAIRGSDGYFSLLFHDPFVRGGYEDGLVVEWTAELLDSVNAMFGQDVRYMTVGAAADHLRGAGTGAYLPGPVASVHLDGAAPNPFANETSVRFSVDEPQHVRLSAFDLLGRRVAVLLDERVGAGLHRISWNPAGLPAGHYVIRLETRHASRARLVTVVR